MAKKESECKVTVVAPPEVHLVDVLCEASYYDTQLERNVLYGERLSMSEARALEVAEKGFVVIL